MFVQISDIQFVIAGSYRGAKYQGSRMAAGSGTQFGKTVRPMQGAGLLAERCFESRGRSPRQVSLNPFFFLQRQEDELARFVKSWKLIPRLCSGEAKNDWVWLCPRT